jgi:outer membrane protein assembly factor BamA
MPLREGEIFSVGKVRASIEALTKLYGSRGYIDFTGVPDTEVDEHLQRISLAMHLDEQKQFRVGSIEIRGLDPNLEARLRSIIVPGDVINMDPVNAFFKEYQSALPPRGIDNLRITRDVRTGIADITFDAQSCTGPETQEPTAQHLLRSR